MATRPTRRIRWAYNAPGGALVEPPSPFAAAGFYSNERPPAQWANYLFHFTSAWTDYLAGPGWGSWERASHGGSAPVFTGVAGLAVDTDDATAALARRRYVIAGATSGGLALAVSRTGREWITRSPPSTATELHGVLAVGSYFLLWGMAGAVAALWRTQRDDVVPSVASAITLDDADLWSVVGSFSAPVSGVAAVVWDGASRVGRLLKLADAFAFGYSDDEGATWAAVFDGGGLVSGAVASGLAWDAVRGRWLAASDKGDVALLTVGTSWTTPVLLPSMPTTAQVHLRAGGGTCVAWASLNRTGDPLDASRIWRSDDGGATWAAVALPSTMGASITDVTYVDGVWLATGTAAPHLWRSDDGGATWERVQLPIGEESSWALYRAVYADGAVTATGLTWTVQTTRATGLAPDATRVYSPEPGYLADAGYLRGRRIAATAPTDGQLLVWDAGGGLWTPGAAGMSNPMTTAGDLITGGASGTPTRLAVGAEGERLTVVGGVPAWAAAPSGGIDTSLQAAPDTGWTAAGDGSAAIASGVVSQTVTAAQTLAVLRRTMISSPSLPAIELSARVTVTTVPSSGNYYVGLGILNSTVPTNAGSTRGVVVFCDPTYAWPNMNVSGGWSQPTYGSTPAALTSGTVWLRIVYGGAVVTWWVGVGATRPTSWTRIHTASVPELMWQDVDQVALYAERAGGGSGDYVVEWSDIQWRSLLGAPA